MQSTFKPEFRTTFKIAGLLLAFVGISEKQLPNLFAVAKEYNLRIIGTHQHLGSLFLNDKIPNYIAVIWSQGI